MKKKERNIINASIRSMRQSNAHQLSFFSEEEARVIAARKKGKMSRNFRLFFFVCLFFCFFFLFVLK